MSWHPGDLVSDADLVAYESNILTTFAKETWETKRLKALEDWLGPILRTQGYDIERLRTRYEADAVLGYTDGSYTAISGAATDTTTYDLNLETILATPANDALFIGSTKQFRGVSVRLHDSVSSVAAGVRAYTWSDAWRSVAVTDRTTAVPSKSFSGGGALTWRIPSEWVRRTLPEADGQTLYWVKLTMNATPTGATAGQIGVIRRSLLCAPATFRTLALIFREAPTGGPGPWDEKAAYYETEADAALQRALQIVGGEFDPDESDQISPDEAAQTSAEVASGWRMERA